MPELTNKEALRQLRARRERLGMTQTEFAQRVGVSLYAVYNWERGLVRPRADNLRRIMAVLAEAEETTESAPGAEARPKLRSATSWTGCLD